MSSTPLIPQAFWFRLELECPREDQIPRATSRGRLLDLTALHELPSVASLTQAEPWAAIRVAWNSRGLGIAVEVSGKTRPVMKAHPDDPHFVDGFQVWIDTRDTRDIHRASRYCHRFALTLEPESNASKELKSHVEQRTIHRTMADAPRAPLSALRSYAERRRDGWLAELFLGAEALNGYDPDTNRRLGFSIQVTDPERGDLFLGVGREFPIGEDPSLWATLVLSDPGST